VLAASAVFLAHASAASAGIATVGGGTLTFAAGLGEANSVGIALDPTVRGYKITDATAPVMGGPGCGALDAEIDCEDPGVSVIVINLRDGNDKWYGGDIKLVPTVNGGDGNDDLRGIGLLSGGAGNDLLEGLDSGASLNGDEGDDTLIGGAGDDTLDGGPGNDLLIGNDGADRLIGGPGLDRIDASGDGPKTVDCQGRDDEIIQGGSNVKRVNCPPAPVAHVAIARTSAKRLVSRGLGFSVSCDRPCAVQWQLQLDGAARKLVHTGSGRLAARSIPLDGDGFRNPSASTQRFTARVSGKATRTALAGIRSFSATLGVRVFGRDGLSGTVSKPVKFR
jgi:RTX calcium-binding nonapeptide repeat (4 copies)